MECLLAFHFLFACNLFLQIRLQILQVLSILQLSPIYTFKVTRDITLQANFLPESSFVDISVNTEDVVKMCIRDRQHTEKIADTAGWLQNVALREAHLPQGGIDAADDHRRRVERLSLIHI